MTRDGSYLGVFGSIEKSLKGAGYPSWLDAISSDRIPNWARRVRSQELPIVDLELPTLPVCTPPLLRLRFYTSDAGSDQAKARRVYGMMFSECSHDMFFDCDCLMHSCHLMVGPCRIKFTRKRVCAPQRGAPILAIEFRSEVAMRSLQLQGMHTSRADQPQTHMATSELRVIECTHTLTSLALVDIKVQSGLIAADHVVKLLVGSDWKYLGTLCQITHCWRNHATSIFKAWSNDPHGKVTPPDAVSKLCPKCIVGRWGSASACERHHLDAFFADDSNSKLKSAP